MKSPNRQFLIGFCLFTLVVLFGFAGYRMAGWSSLDALYMVIITIFGVGYGEVRELDPNLRIFTIVFIIAGCSVLIYTVGALVNWLTEGQLEKLLGRRKMEKEINRLHGHVVICGFGRMGRLLSARLAEAKQPFLVIDRDRGQVELLRESGYCYLEGDATEEDTLQKAQIEKAAVVATVLPSDAANVFIVLSCRALNPQLTIIARANQISSEAKLRQAGTDKVVMPAAIGADRIANLVLKPKAQEVLERDLQDNLFIESLHEIGLEMEEIAIPPESPLVGSTLEDLETRGKSAFIVVAVRSDSGVTTLKPSLELELAAGDTLIVMSHSGTVADFIRRNLARKGRIYRGIAH